MFLHLCHDCGIVAHQDYELSHNLVSEGIQSQLNCLHLKDVDMKTEFFIYPNPCCCQVLQMWAPTSSQHICKQEKRWRGTPNVHLSSYRHHLTHSKHSSGTAGSSVAEDQSSFSCHDSAPGNKPFWEGYVALELLPYLCRGRRVTQKAALHFSESANPGVHWVDPLPDGVYQHPEILSHAGWLEV